MEAPKLHWGLGYTLNVGNFQSIRLDHALTDSARSYEDLEVASDRIYKFVETELVKKLKEAVKELDWASHK